MEIGGCEREKKKERESKEERGKKREACHSRKIGAASSGGKKVYDL